MTPITPHIVVGGPLSSPIGPPVSPPLRAQILPQRAADISRQQRADVGTSLIRSTCCVICHPNPRCLCLVLFTTGLFPKSPRCGLKASRPLERAFLTGSSKRSSRLQRSDAARCRDRAAELFGRLFRRPDETSLHRKLRDLPGGNLSDVSRRSSILGAPGYLCQHTEL